MQNTLRKILILDDHKIFKESLAMLLTKNGYQVSTESVAVEAIERIRKHQFDLIITDLSMPDYDGYYFLKRVDKILKGRAKIIVLSCFDYHEIKKKLNKYPFSAYLNKAVSSDELIQIVQELIDGAPSVELPYIHHTFLAKDKNQLSLLEIEVLKLIVEEKTSNEIANLLNLSYSKVDWLRKKLLVKTNSKNVVGLIKYAINHIG